MHFTEMELYMLFGVLGLSAIFCIAVLGILAKVIYNKIKKKD